MFPWHEPDVEVDARAVSKRRQGRNRKLRVGLQAKHHGLRSQFVGLTVESVVPHRLLHPVAAGVRLL